MWKSETSNFGGIVRQVALGFVPEAEVGDYVLVHVGFAISRLDEKEAKGTYALLEQLGAIEARTRARAREGRRLRSDSS